MPAQQNLVDFVPTAQELTAYDAALATIEAFHQKYGVALSPAQRQSLPRLAPEAVAAADDALAVAQTDASFLPRAFEVAEFEQDAALHNLLAPRFARLTRVLEIADDTLLALRSDLYTGVLTVYNYSKGRVTGPGMDRLSANLGKRFQRPKRGGGNDGGGGGGAAPAPAPTPAS